MIPFESARFKDGCVIFGDTKHSTLWYRNRVQTGLNC